MSAILSPKQGGVVTQYDFTNFSTAKQKYSFCKSPRFPAGQYRIVSDKVQYELPSAFDQTGGILIPKRAPSFGIGERFNSATKQGKYMKIIVYDSPPTFSRHLQSEISLRQRRNTSDRQEDCLLIRRISPGL